jgi:hypothetical protein
MRQLLLAILILNVFASCKNSPQQDAALNEVSRNGSRSEARYKSKNGECLVTVRDQHGSTTYFIYDYKNEKNSAITIVNDPEKSFGSIAVYCGNGVVKRRESKISISCEREQLDPLTQVSRGNGTITFQSKNKIDVEILGEYLSTTNDKWNEDLHISCKGLEKTSS